MSRPCSSCGDGDTAMRCHDHSNLHPFPARPGAKVGIAIDLDQLQALMQEFIDEHPPDNPSRTEYEWRFSTFLYWLRKRMEIIDESKSGS
jgi:hypothetical protein